MSNAILQRLGIYRRAIGRCTGRLESTREFIVLAVLYSPIWKRFARIVRVRPDRHRDASADCGVP